MRAGSVSALAAARCRRRLGRDRWATCRRSSAEPRCTAVQLAMIEQCESLRDRFAMLDPPFETALDPRLGLACDLAWRRRFDSSYGALYFPWLVVSDPLRTPGRAHRRIPPSGHVAGFIADTDLRIGVHKAPANGALSWVQDLAVPIDDNGQGVLNRCRSTRSARSLPAACACSARGRSPAIRTGGT